MRPRTAALHLALCASLVLLAGCASQAPKSEAAQSAPAPPSAVPEIRPGIPAGYLQQAQYPDSLALVPAPPAAGSAAFAHDQAVREEAITLRGTPRWQQAVSDADLHFPHAAGTFECALGIPLTQQATPRLYMLLQRSMVDAGLATYKAKNHYNRTRPFVMAKEASCTPDEEAALRKDGSYPSGHTTIGWAWALILAELAPDHANAVLARGRSFGESRLVCNVHWQSDILEGRFMGASTVARLHADPTFEADMAAAKAEISDARSKGLAPARDCAAEATALQQKLERVL
ncbi:phosphatase PAP2 family protein [Lysobacter sp. S4-A87]|uniref:acid phosphatase n=1 Tax=Lysobacter sp. S4-A87 TaxID=2925843 RepID=UPI001F53DDC2|nr:phosphatase PAP2 family protein [Lysobacter sp. S4-A87]UNK48175.1 phosphatase PAP2 family protein [Lysobacter sp. S4-A87]